MNNVDRAGRVHSLKILDDYHWIYLSNLARCVAAQLGKPGLDAVYEGIFNYGYARGEKIRESAKILASSRNAVSIFQAWDAADLLLASPGERFDINGTPDETWLRFDRFPGADYPGINEQPDLVDRYWHETLRGISAGFDEHLSLEWNVRLMETSGIRELKCQFRGTTVGQDFEMPDDVIGDPAACIDLSRQSIGGFAALCMHTAQSLFDQFDATGEKAVRDALYAFGLERARGMRDDVLAEGKPLNFQTWFEAIQKRDPNSAAFVFRGDTWISPGVFQVTCTYCPCAQNWAEQGNKGLNYGQIYDLEVHRGLVEGFHPDGIVAWDKLKTRGDKVCNFRFFIPELISDEDPEWAQQKRP